MTRVCITFKKIRFERSNSVKNTDREWEKDT